MITIASQYGFNMTKMYVIVYFMLA